MRHIITRWFYVYNRLTIGISLLIIAGCFGVWYFPALAQYRQANWLLYVICGFAFTQITYSVFVIRHQTVLEQSNPAVSKLASKLNSREQQSEILIESITDGVVVVDTNGVITLMNRAAAIMSQWKVEDAIGIDVRNVLEFAQEDGRPLEENDPFTTVLKTLKPSDKTLELKGHDKKQTIVSLVASPVIVPGSSTPMGAVAVLRDVSAARAEEKRRADFISTASHEMRTPVAAIEGYLALALNDRVSTIDSRAREYLQKAHSSTQHLGQLFQDLLTSAKAEDGRLTSHPRIIEMGEFVEKLTDDLRFSAEKKGLLMDFTFGVAGNATSIDASHGANGSLSKVVRPLYYVEVDPDRIREVVTNLFDNAVKYTETGKISLGLTGNNDVVQVYVRDTGQGIPAADIPHLFQKFYRVDSSSTRTIGGTGLGLFICRKIINLYHGQIWVESTEGQGSTFYINLPRVETQKAAQLKSAETSKANNSPTTTVQPTVAT